MFFFFLTIRRPPRSTRTDTLVPYTTLFRSPACCLVGGRTSRPAAFAHPAATGMVVAPRSSALSARHARWRSEEHTSELQSLMRTSYAVFCLKKKQLITQP